MAWLVVVVPAVSGLLVWRTGTSRARLAAGALGSLAAAVALGAWAAATEATAALDWGPQLELTLTVTGFGRVMIVLVPAVALAVVAYACGAEADDPAVSKLVGLLVAFVGAMSLLVAAGDLLTLLIGWELVGALSWALIGHHWRDASRPQRAAHAFVTTRFGDLGLYLAAGAAFAATGSLSFDRLGAAGRPELDVVAGGVLLAAAAKSAQLPFSPWLFSAMAGPTPVSALLHSATMVAAGAYALGRLAPAFAELEWFTPAVVAVGATTALAGGVVAFLQTDLKKALAASTSAQFGMMFVAIGAGAVAAGGAQLLTQAMFKALLFLTAGMAIHAAASNDLGSMRLGRTLPRVSLLAGVGTLALAAVPPTGGAFSKEAILSAAAHLGPVAGVSIVGAGVLSALYAFRMQLLAYGPGDGRARQRPGSLELAGAGALAAATLALSVLWLPSAERLVVRLGGSDLVPAASWELPVTLVGLAAAGAVVWWLDRRAALVTAGLPVRVHAAAEDWLGLPTLARRVVADPVLALAGLLARADDRVVDAGVRAASALAAAASRLLSWWAERGLDGAVRGVAAGVLAASRAVAGGAERFVDGAVAVVAGAALRSASGSRIADERGVDRAVEELAAGVGVAGTAGRRTQTGLAHHYYGVATAGAVLIAAAAAIWR